MCDRRAKLWLKKQNIQHDSNKWSPPNLWVSAGNVALNFTEVNIAFIIDIDKVYALRQMAECLLRKRKKLCFCVPLLLTSLISLLFYTFLFFLPPFCIWPKNRIMPCLYVCSLSSSTGQPVTITVGTIWRFQVEPSPHRPQITGAYNKHSKVHPGKSNAV